jgi:hypothetical protein
MLDKKVTDIDAKVANAVQKELTEVMAQTLEKYGLGIEGRGGSLGTQDLTLKFNIFVQNSDGENAKKEEAFVGLALSYGLRCDYGFTFSHNGSTLKVVGISPSRPKFPVDLINLDTGGKSKSPIRFVNEYAPRAASVSTGR